MPKVRCSSIFDLFIQQVGRKQFTQQITLIFPYIVAKKKFHIQRSMFNASISYTGILG